jgi:hypothetical protein
MAKMVKTHNVMYTVKRFSEISTVLGWDKQKVRLLDWIFDWQLYSSFFNFRKGAIFAVFCAYIGTIFSHSVDSHWTILCKQRESSAIIPNLDVHMQHCCSNGLYDSIIAPCSAAMMRLKQFKWHESHICVTTFVHAMFLPMFHSWDTHSCTEIRGNFTGVRWYI